MLLVDFKSKLGIIDNQRKGLYYIFVFKEIFKEANNEKTSYWRSNFILAFANKSERQNKRRCCKIQRILENKFQKLIKSVQREYILYY